MYYLLVTIVGITVCVGGGVNADELCLVGDFDSQLQQILQKYTLTESDIANMIRVLDDVVPTLNKRWSDLIVFPFGSLTTGLGLKTSDVDFYVHMPNCTNLEDMSCVLEETVNLFKSQPTLYSNITTKNEERFSVIILYHIPLQRWVDIVHKFGYAGVYNSKLIRYYFTLDKRFTALGNFLKIWFAAYGITGSAELLPNYALYLLIIFYLQQKNLAPSVFKLQQIESPTHFVDKWNFDFNELPYNTTNTENVHQLLGGFFKYYSEFNFEDYIVAPFAGRPLSRNAFVDIKKFPKEYTLYKKSIREELQFRIQNKLNINTTLCIQDLFQHFVNTGERLTQVDSIKFKGLIKTAAKLFDKLPSNEFIRAILTLNQHNVTITDHKTAPGDEPINQENCINIHPYTHALVPQG